MLDTVNSRIEEGLSQFGALLSLAADDIAAAKETIKLAELRLQKLQAEIEKMYITLNEPIVVVGGKS